MTATRRTTALEHLQAAALDLIAAHGNIAAALSGLSPRRAVRAAELAEQVDLCRAAATRLATVVEGDQRSDGSTTR